MVIGVAGVLVTTLAMHFGASWVFLYPLPFESAGQWSDTAAGIFSASVLLAGASILTWCIGILHTILSPALHAVRDTLPTRLGLAVGLGYLWPRRFATNPSSVPYPVIPLTVIGIDMLIATTPLAVLLVVMVVKAIDPGVTVDPLLAKNVLWFFGHPVVYLLLFPAVAIYYYLVPRMAGRPLVAGNVIAIAWVVAVVVNVLIWAHHVYLDYPEDSLQGALNTVSQPLTFAIVLPSALSIYSLFATVYRSRIVWNTAAQALFLAIVSWLLAGMSGVVNATIAFDVVVHNTLWVVGHFHHMALLNIGLVVIGAIYAFLPELTGKPLYSETLGKWHVWLTFVGATANSALWLWQGLDGAPRRFASLPSEYGALNGWALPFVAMIAFAQVLFVYNVVQTVRGKGVGRVAVRRTWSEATAEAVFVLLALGLAALAFAVGFYLGRDTAGGDGGTGATTAAQTEREPAGEAVFAEAGCGSCHTLSAAGSRATVGPNLDETTLDVRAIEARIRTGGGAMPAFEGRLSDEEIRQVAAFVKGG
jgi:cytochrome c oxidase subunit 1